MLKRAAPWRESVIRPQRTAPWREPAATAPHGEDHARQWANTMPNHHYQKKKPEGDNGPWDERTSDHPKTMKNFRKGFKFELNRAIHASDELPDAPTAALLEETSQHLMRLVPEAVLPRKNPLFYSSKDRRTGDANRHGRGADTNK